MRPKQLTRYAFVAALLLPIAWATNAATLSVNCGSNAGLHSIGVALKVLQSSDSEGPSTIKVSGACTENVTISGFTRLALLAAPGASISDASGGTVDVLQVLDSSTVHLVGFTLNGSVSCLESSTCTFTGDTFQGSSGDGVTVSRSYLDLLPGTAVHGNFIQNSAGGGLLVLNGSVVRTIELTVQHNGAAGAFLQSGGNLTAYSSSFVSNGGEGISVLNHSTLNLFGGVVQGNTSDGVLVYKASEARVVGSGINKNSGNGVSVQDLSFVVFTGSPTPNVTGNLGGTDVVCLPQFPATRGALTNIGGGSTNCVEP